MTIGTEPIKHGDMSFYGEAVLVCGGVQAVVIFHWHIQQRPALRTAKMVMGRRVAVKIFRRIAHLDPPKISLLAEDI